MELEAPADLAAANASEQDENTREDLDRLKRILVRHHMAFLGSVKALPYAVRGMVCDLDVETGTNPLSH
ncbi:hypothetical protein PybrP1_006804 [[Pythium] brassicae (nom. inval.)]|nr:hypothetical protein PybrP1_006804 [[Pythium] brassicae (nom. inval.)]